MWGQGGGGEGGRRGEGGEGERGGRGSGRVVLSQTLSRVQIFVNTFDPRSQT